MSNKRYYPLKNLLDVYHMDVADRIILSKWVKCIKDDIRVYNEISLQKAIDRGCYQCRQIEFVYSGNIFQLSKNLCNINNLGYDINEEDIEFLNQVLYRHKYNCILSMWLFPAKPIEQARRDLNDTSKCNY